MLFAISLLHGGVNLGWYAMLSAIRQDIDQIDQELLGLLLRRMDCSKEVAAYKLANGLPVLNIGREQEILDRIRQNAGSEYGDAAALIFSAVMDVSRGLQHRRMAGGQPLRDRLASASNALIPPAEARVACSAGRAPMLTKPPAVSSQAGRCRGSSLPLQRCSPLWKRDPPIMGWFRWKTPPPARFMKSTI